MADEMGWDVFSVDKEPFENIDLAKDILQLAPTDVPFVPDVIWASPVCTTYSIAAISTHRDGTEPKTQYAAESDRMLEKTLDIIGWYPGVKYFIENPMGMMRMMPQLQGIDRAEVTYCSYGDTRMKPTDIFTNYLRSMFLPDAWQPRDKCRNGETRCHHEAAPRGSRTGTQGLKGSYERSKIPQALAMEILRSCT